MSQEGLSRRDFLSSIRTYTGGFVSGLAASYISGHLPIVDLNSLFSPYSERNFTNLFLAKQKLAIHCGAAHYLVKGTHSDNSVIGGVVADCMSDFMDMNPSEEAESFQLQPDCDWVLVGSPSSNVISKQALGYGKMLHEGPIVLPNGLRYYYKFGEEMHDVRRFDAGGTLQEQALETYICDSKMGSKFGVDPGGWIEEDYLLITRIPRSTNNGVQHTTVVGGLHGTGTRGLELLLKQDVLSKRQRKLLADSWNRPLQILSKIEVTNEVGASTPSHISVIDVHVA